MENTERIKEDLMAPRNNDGRDELNLAEFPICALSHRLRADQKTLRFEDQLFDKQRGEMITRQLTITGSDAYGLPTALDDEVLLGLIQLTRLHDFTDRKVPFTRHHLLKILGWRNESKSYARVEASLNRWTGVTLYYRNAWWNLARKCWVDEKFHVLDNVWLCHRDSPLPDTGLATDGAPVSAFVWNEVLFRSFQAGNLKSLDFDFYRDLRSAVAKRLYRFLDKRFYQRARWEFDLKEFAWEHAGLARGYDTANLKRKLRPAIAELEQKGYLQPMPESVRFRKACAGQWRVVFQERGLEEKPEINSPKSGPDESLIVSLTQRGVSFSIARDTVLKCPAKQVELQVEVFDWLVEREDARISRNPPGYLLSAIRQGYLPPKEFLIQHQHIKQNQSRAELRRQAKEGAREKEQQRLAEEKKQAQVVREFWNSLSDEDRSYEEQEAMRQATPAQRSLVNLPGRIGPTARRNILDNYALRRLSSS